MQTKCSKAVSVHKEFLLCKFLFQIFKRKTDWVLSNFPNVSWSMKYREQKIFYSLLINSNRFHPRGSVIFNLSKNLKEYFPRKRYLYVKISFKCYFLCSFYKHRQNILTTYFIHFFWNSWSKMYDISKKHIKLCHISAFHLG